MIDFALALVSGGALALGCFFLLSGAVGLLRFPDFYSRMHAAGMTDTLASFLILGGLMLMAGWSLALFKLGLILLFIFFTGPTASHALAKAAQHGRQRLVENAGPRMREHEAAVKSVEKTAELAADIEST